MQNGDRYVGKVLSLNSDTLILQNDVLGTMHLPRSKVTSINLGSVLPQTTRPQVAAGAGGHSPRPTATNSLSLSPAATPGLINRLALANPSGSDLTAAFREMGTNSPLIQQVRSQFLNDAGPEANKKFNDLLGGLMSGNLSVQDIRLEAKSAADQIRAMRKDLGEDAGGALDGYLAILDSFLKETETTYGATNAPSASPKPKSAASPEEQ